MPAHESKTNRKDRFPVLNVNIQPYSCKHGYGQTALQGFGRRLFEILRSWKDFTLSELQFRKGMGELLRQKVRLEAFPNGSPMSVL
jgi:hypothetical protein